MRSDLDIADDEYDRRPRDFSHMTAERHEEMRQYDTTGEHARWEDEGHEHDREMEEARYGLGLCPNCDEKRAQPGCVRPVRCGQCGEPVCVDNPCCGVSTPETPRTWTLVFCQDCGEMLGVQDHVRVRDEHFGYAGHRGMRFVEAYEAGPVDAERERIEKHVRSFGMGPEYTNDKSLASCVEHMVAGCAVAVCSFANVQGSQWCAKHEKLIPEMLAERERLLDLLENWLRPASAKRLIDPLGAVESQTDAVLREYGRLGKEES